MWCRSLLTVAVRAAFLQGIVDEMQLEPTTPSPPSCDLNAKAAAHAEALLQKLRARPVEVSRTEKIDAAWRLFDLAKAMSAGPATASVAGGVTTLTTMVPLLLEWLQPTLARSERYVMGGSANAAAPSAPSRQAKKKQKIRHHEENDEDDGSAKPDETAVRIQPSGLRPSGF